MVEKNTVTDDIMDESVPEEVAGSNLDEIRVVNETSNDGLEEGELRDSMHGEEGGNNNLHGEFRGEFNDKVANMSGVQEGAEKSKSSFLFNAIN